MQYAHNSPAVHTGASKYSPHSAHQLHTDQQKDVDKQKYALYARAMLLHASGIAVGDISHPTPAYMHAPAMHRHQCIHKTQHPTPPLFLLYGAHSPRSHALGPCACPGHDRGPLLELSSCCHLHS
jgi:hypothetical protein